tara:strand:- start:926 stop:1396 length:471 start_codon:yes stop_codon:yes gene_type:complete
MAFKLSQRSFQRLVGVQPQLVETVKLAINYTTVDFGVIYGVRDLATQEKLFKSGKSQTMKSKHLLQGDGYSHAVDLMAYDSGEPSWDIVDYWAIADSMKKASQETGITLRWGASWHIDSINSWDKNMEDAYNDYVDLRRSQGRTPFIDGPHFELNE